MTINPKLFATIIDATNEAVFEAISPAMVAIALSPSPETHLTLKIKLLASITEGLTRTLAALMCQKVHDQLDKSLSEKGLKASEDAGVNLLQNLSPEVLLFASLFVHFEGQGGYPAERATALLKSLGHEIPEILIPGAKV